MLTFVNSYLLCMGEGYTVDLFTYGGHILILVLVAHIVEWVVLSNNSDGREGGKKGTSKPSASVGLQAERCSVEMDLFCYCRCLLR